MATFTYRGHKPGSGIVKGEVHGLSMGAVAEQLMNRGIEPLHIEQVAEKKAAMQLQFLEKWPSEDDLILFTRQMYTLSKSGVPLIRALQGLTDTTPNKRLVDAMYAIIEALQTGRDLSACLAEHPRIFNQLYLRIVRIGEETGRLEESFQQLFHYMEIEKETKKKIKSALRYPTFVIIAMILALFVLNYYVIPAFTSVFKQFGAELPWATQVLLKTSSFTVAYGAQLLGGIALVIFGFNYYINHEGEMWWDRVKLKLPLVGSILNRATLARYSRAFAMGSRSGLPVVNTLVAVGDAVDNVFVASRVNEMRNGIERGESLVQASYASQLFTPLVLQMIAVGEETGQMDDMMNEVAEFYEREVSYDVDNLSSAIEPIMIGFIGVLVLILALGIFLPMWDLGSAAMKKH